MSFDSIIAVASTSAAAASALAAWFSWRSAKQALVISQESLVAFRQSERPWIIVEPLLREAGMQPGWSPSQRQALQDPRSELIRPAFSGNIRNIGKGVAILTSICVRLHFQTSASSLLPKHPAYEGITQLRTTIGPGDTVGIAEPLYRNNSISTEEMAGIMRGTHILFAWGKITYESAHGVRGRVCFLYEFVPPCEDISGAGKTISWRLVPNENYSCVE